MEQMLATMYGIIAEEQIEMHGYIGFKKDEWIYFTTLVDNKEAIFMEQAVLAYHLVDNNYSEVAHPIQNNEEKWITNWQGEQWIVYKKDARIDPRVVSEGEALASFHKKNRNYQYEPTQISSFGRWKSLWIQKLTTFEDYLNQAAAKETNHYYRLIMDVLPYLIGISENAIQYMEETEGELRYDDSDQGTITFQRYEAQMSNALIFPDMLVFDHYTRDIAEYIRPLLLSSQEAQMDEAKQFMKEYMSIQSLSLFSMRLVYARLLFPLHIFDLIGFLMDSKDETEQYEKFSEMINKQNDYEKNLKLFTEFLGVDDKRFSLPMVQWL